MAIYDITFHPAWWHKRTGVSFDKKFFLNPDYRIQADMLMRRFLFENFPEIYPSESYMVQPVIFLPENIFKHSCSDATFFLLTTIFQRSNAPI